MGMAGRRRAESHCAWDAVATKIETVQSDWYEMEMRSVATSMSWRRSVTAPTLMR